MILNRSAWQPKFALIFFVLLTALTNEAKAQKRSEKYLNAYQQYLNATCPIPKDHIQHFVYFARDRELIHKHPLLKHGLFQGAQIMYAWRNLEPKKDQYDFSEIKKDYEYLKKHGKQLFIQLQDATFNPNFQAVPEYLLIKDYEGGATPQFNDEGKAEGWVAKRWNPEVQARFALLLQALGNIFDGKIAGINLQETSIGVSEKTDTSFSEKAYFAGLQANMRALKKAFPQSTTMIYANFMPGEWLPAEDQGYLRSIYQYGEKIGVGLGAPDLMPTRKGQLNHAYTMMHEGQYTVPLGIAVQDGNYTATTGADKDYDEKVGTGAKTRKSLVPQLHAFAKDFLKVKYMFWVDQQPYFGEDVLPCFSKQ